MDIKLSQSKGLSKEEFFGRLFEIRDQIHLKHLRVSGTGAYAQHVALGNFYESLLDLTDELIESYQGKYGIVSIKMSSPKDEDPILIIENLAKLLDAGQIYNMFKETWIQNQLDEISKLCYKTLYKLKNLK
jgi:hypothetical protein